MFKMIKDNASHTLVVFLFIFFFPIGTGNGMGQSYPVKKGTLLIAQSSISGSIFNKSVVLITQHSREEGTQGLIINKPSGHAPGDVLPPNSGADKLYEILFIGGPVILSVPSLLIDTEIPPENAMNIFSHVYLSMSLDKVLGEENTKRHKQIRIYAGISNWAPGQLELEITNGDWLTLGPDTETVFTEEPEGIWEELMKQYEKRGTGILI